MNTTFTSDLHIFDIFALFYSRMISPIDVVLVVLFCYINIHIPSTKVCLKNCTNGTAKVKKYKIERE